MKHGLQISLNLFHTLKKTVCFILNFSYQFLIFLFLYITGSYKYCLCVIDNFSKMAFMKPLKNKTTNAVTNALEQIFKETGRIPQKIHHDEGSKFIHKLMEIKKMYVNFSLGEFISKQFKSMIDKYSITSYHTYSEIKCGIVER